MERTWSVGQHSDTSHPGFFTRLSRPRAIRESSSLKPSKVRMAMRMAVESCSVAERRVNEARNVRSASYRRYSIQSKNCHRYVSTQVHNTMGQVRYKQVVDALASDIRAGQLRPGTRLPTHRALAQRHGLALATASRVYAELEAIGLVVGETGRGTPAAGPPAQAGRLRRPGIAAALPPLRRPAARTRHRGRAPEDAPAASGGRADRERKRLN